MVTCAAVYYKLVLLENLDYIFNLKILLGQSHTSGFIFILGGGGKEYLFGYTSDYMGVSNVHFYTGPNRIPSR